ncbi:unnamed protein product [Amoebophrya sp. A25]|nr:unnamed protein product [Amoebophrya sp. A25]|eukprot:GSA25T00000410001.1
MDENNHPSSSSASSRRDRPADDGNPYGLGVPRRASGEPDLKRSRVEGVAAAAVDHCRGLAAEAFRRGKTPDEVIKQLSRMYASDRLGNLTTTEFRQVLDEVAQHEHISNQQTAGATSPATIFDDTAGVPAPLGFVSVSDEPMPNAVDSQSPLGLHDGSASAGAMLQQGAESQQSSMSQGSASQPSAVSSVPLSISDYDEVPDLPRFYENSENEAEKMKVLRAGGELIQHLAGRAKKSGVWYTFLHNYTRTKNNETGDRECKYKDWRTTMPAVLAGVAESAPSEDDDGKERTHFLYEADFYGLLQLLHNACKHVDDTEKRTGGVVAYVHENARNWLRDYARAAKPAWRETEEDKVIRSPNLIFWVVREMPDVLRDAHAIRKRCSEISARERALQCGSVSKERQLYGRLRVMSFAHGDQAFAFGGSALHKAVEGGAVEDVRKHVQHGIDLEWRNTWGETALECAEYYAGRLWESTEETEKGRAWASATRKIVKVLRDASRTLEAAPS